MENQDQRFWPFERRTSVILALILLFIFLVFLRITAGWPSKDSEKFVLIGILILSFLPVLLALADVIIARGGSFEIRGIKIDLSKVEQIGISSFTIPENIASPGAPVTDSDTKEILKELKLAAKNDIVIINLEEGNAWWETRLLILLSGAERLGKPSIVVFVSTNAGKQNQFVGWAYASMLLQCLMEEDKLYNRCVLITRAAANQWNLVEPLYPNPPDIIPNSPPAYPWMAGLVSTSHSWMAYPSDGLPNVLFAEQLLANELGKRIESQPGGQRKIDLYRLDELFRTVLNRTTIDQRWPEGEQMDTFFNNDDLYFAITYYYKYIGMVSKLTVINELLKNMVMKKENV